MSARRATSALLGLGLVALACLSGAFVTPAAAAADAPDFEVTRTVTREHAGTGVVDSRTVTVQVDRTQSLRGRERVQVSWSGARPSAGRAANPYGFDGLNQEYPVVVLQCRGRDDATLPEAQQLRPETCWTTTYPQRYAATSPSAAVWQHDLVATEEDRASQDDAVDWPAECPRLPGSLIAQHLLPFVAADGTVYPSCSDTTIPPESSIDAALPAADVAAFTNLDGTGSVQFEVRSETENESLGCSSTVECSIVVIPVMGVSCGDDDPTCRQAGDFEPGSYNGANLGVDAAVGPRYWWSESNWRNRFTVPITFGLPPDACDVLDDRAPVDMFGSELLNQASLQWAPAYCLRQDRFKFRHNRMSESSALRLLGTGEGVAAFVSDAAPASDLELGYAPVAVTGFAISYVSDLPDNAGEATQLRLTPRLLAKLLTQSYPASASGRAHDGLEDNPLSLNTDPEFVELNPGLSTIAEEARATVLSLSEASDVMTAVTSYIATDDEAMAFLAGEKDPWGMVVNPSYQDIDVPREDWPMLDTFVRDISRECEKLNPAPYFSLVAGPVNSLRKISEAMLDAWPNVQTQCTRATSTDPWKFGRIARQSYGARFMLGLVSLGDAERYGLRTAQLRTDGAGVDATFVGVSTDAMAAALTAATHTGADAPFTIDRGALDPSAYPGTMVVHATARLSGLPAADAAHVAQFVRTATTEGQEPGPGNGQLPDGFLPILATGPTAALFASAQATADAIEAQAGPTRPPAPSPSSPPPGPVPGAPAVPVAGLAGAPGGGALPPAAAAGPVDGLPAPAGADVVAGAATGTTVVQRSATAGTAVKATLGLALAGVLGAPLIRWLTTRQTPL